MVPYCNHSANFKGTWQHSLVHVCALFCVSFFTFMFVLRCVRVRALMLLCTVKASCGVWDKNVCVNLRAGEESLMCACELLPRRWTHTWCLCHHSLTVFNGMVYVNQGLDLMTMSSWTKHRWTKKIFHAMRKKKRTHKAWWEQKRKVLTFYRDNESCSIWKQAHLFQWAIWKLDRQTLLTLLDVVLLPCLTYSGPLLSCQSNTVQMNFIAHRQRNIDMICIW